MKFLFLLSLLVIACGGPVSGVVIQKHYEPENWTLVPMVIPGGCTTVGKVTTCRPPITYFVPINDSEDWILTIKDEKGDNHTRYVPHEYYDSVNLGDYVTEIES